VIRDIERCGGDGAAEMHESVGMLNDIFISNHVEVGSISHQAVDDIVKRSCGVVAK
jgi:hypothetical protein